MKPSSFFDSAEQWHGKGEKRISCRNDTFGDLSSGKITNEKMKVEMKLTIVPKGNNAVE